MKKKNYISGMSRKKWVEEAARLSGEGNGRPVLSDDPVLNDNLRKHWNEIKMIHKESSIDIDNAWIKVSNRISAAEKEEKVVTRSLAPVFLRVAASILLILGLGWTGYRMAMPKQIVTATTATEKNISIYLPDGSVVWLNRNSSLSYPSRFSLKNRKVILKGEAYFDIARDESKPFIIDAGGANVKVLGTSFNVITDNGNSQVEVFVTTGSVLLTSPDGEKSLTLKPGLIGRISDSESTSEVNTNNNYLSWNNEKLVYNGTHLSKVFSDLKRAYDIDVKANDEAINDFTLTTVFEEQPHDTIIKVICTTFNLTYVKDGESYLLMRN
jgi:transmembrane sensor